MIEGTTSSSSTIAQKAAEAALDGPQDCVGEMVAGYRLRRDLVVDLLREAGLLLTVPEGGIPLLADVSPTALDSQEFAVRLLREHGVAVAPAAPSARSPAARCGSAWPALTRICGTGWAGSASGWQPFSVSRQPCGHHL